MSALTNPSSFRGASRSATKTALKREGWEYKGVQSKGSGLRYVHPDHYGSQALIEKGGKVIKGGDPVHGEPYLKVSFRGVTTRVPLKGKPTIRGRASVR